MRTELTFVDTSEDASNSTLLFSFVGKNPLDDLRVDLGWSKFRMPRDEFGEDSKLLNVVLESVVQFIDWRVED